MAELKQSPIFSKSYDFLLWLINHTEKFPKSERFRLARRLEESMFLFHDTLMQATRTRSPRRLLLEADLELDRLRLYVRLSHARALLHGSQYQYAAEQLSEIGRQTVWLPAPSGRTQPDNPATMHSEYKKEDRYAAGLPRSLCRRLVGGRDF